MKGLGRAARCISLLLPCLLLLCAFASAQNGADGPLSPTQVLNISLYSIESPLFLPPILNADAAIAVRYALMVIMPLYNNLAACHPKALTFFGERKEYPADICSDSDKISTVIIYSIVRTLEKEWQVQKRLFDPFLRKNGIDPGDRSTDPSTPVGLGNLDGTQIASWFAKDGWNSLGDLSRDNYLQPFEDFSNYEPVNSPTELRFPLRWQPLTQNLGNGRFASQKHVLPYLGGVRPLVLTPKEVRDRRAPRPYRGLDSPFLRRDDARGLRRYIRQLFRISAALTPKQRFLARFWENKLLSLGVIAGSYANALFGPEDLFSQSRWLLGEMLSLHDASIVAWKEKRRHDAVRPKTAIRLLFSGQKFRAFVSKEEGVKTVKAEEWEPFIPTQPHSEYPSGSSLLCSASFDHAKMLTEEAVKAKNLTKAPPVALDFPDNFFPFDQAGLNRISFDSFEDAARSCGVSRLWAGVHFAPSIPTGLVLGKGIGVRAYEFVRDLANGKVPERCIQCSVGSS